MKSEKVQVLVTDKTCQTSEETILAEDKDETATSEPSATQTADYDDKTVYITPTGKKYHLSSSCAGKNAIETTLGEIKDKYAACKKCAGG